MTYRINVAKGYGKNWNDTGLQYAHYFAVETDMISADMSDLVRELKETYPSPAYDITVTKTLTSSQVVHFL
jgi:hypothetical protein